LKEEALDRTLWRTRFGRGYGPDVRQTAEWINIQIPQRRRSRRRELEEWGFECRSGYDVFVAALCWFCLIPAHVLRRADPPSKERHSRLAITIFKNDPMSLVRVAVCKVPARQTF
jgi:hypothetical protein